MLVNPSTILKTVYKTLLLGVPRILFNPFVDSNLLVPLDIDEISTYINYKLSSNDVCHLTNYIQKYNDSLELTPVKILDDDDEDYYLSINIYNCTSPIFLTDQPVTRCEINTYVVDKFNNYGTVIIDYITNGQSMDPISLFRLPEKGKTCVFTHDKYCNITCISSLTNLNLSVCFKISDNNLPCKIDTSLIKYTDNIFYKDGILDKIYYDQSLNFAKTYKIPMYINFTYRDLQLNKPSSVFYFKNKIKFVGSMWDNIYKIRRFKPTIRQKIGEKIALGYISKR